MAIYHINRAQSIAERLLKLRDYLYTNASPTHSFQDERQYILIQPAKHKKESLRM